MKDILIKVASSNDIDEIIKLKKDVWDKLEYKDWYVIDGTNKDFLENLLKENGLILKAVSGNKIIGFLIVRKNLKKDSSIIKYTHLENEVNYCIELSNAAVDYYYRGNHLYTQMVKKAEKYMMEKYNLKYILSTVHPNNLPSLKSLLKIGYEVVDKVKMYGNKDRCILIKKIH